MTSPGFTEDVLRFISKSFLGFVKLAIRCELLLEQVILVKNA